jgi:hypothetical protein
MPENQLFIIAPYWSCGTWCFDDLERGLVREPFVMGADAMISTLLRDVGVEDPESGFKLIFSTRPFAGHQREALLVREEAGGAWYRTEEPAQEGWLCPALFKYMASVPERIYVRAEAMSHLPTQGTEAGTGPEMECHTP